MSEKRLGLTRMVRNAGENRHYHVGMQGAFVRWYYTLCVCRAVSLKLPFVGPACQKAVPLPIAPGTASPMSNHVS